MIQYQDNEDGSAVTLNGMTIPKVEDNRHYQKMLQEINDGLAEVVPYVAPPKSSKQVRDEALDALTYDFGDGRIIQTRPKDEPNFERAYRLFSLDPTMTTIDWVMKDDVKHPITEAELRTAHDASIVAGAAIWDAYPGA